MERTLVGKTVAVTGSTGGIGRAVCKKIASLGGNLILCDRNEKLSLEHKAELEAYRPDIKIILVHLDFADFSSVKSATQELIALKPDIFLSNAGAYSIPKAVGQSGLINVFEINFLYPYYMIKKLLPTLKEVKGRVVAVGSIAHNYSKTKADNIDFSGKKSSAKIYGNSKRYLMFSLFELFKNEKDVGLAVAHPGITFTKITNHYPKIVFALIKHPMKVIFMRVEKAVESIAEGFFVETECKTWLGPSIFNIWGKPSKKKLNTADESETAQIFSTAERLYEKLHKL